jgi:hypothetical protein
MRITIGGETFSIDCYDLAPCLYDMVLGVQWLESLRPIFFDFRQCMYDMVLRV